MGKSVLFFVVGCWCLMGLFPGSVEADADVGNFTELEGAVEGCENPCEIRITANITLNGTITIPNGTNVTFVGEGGKHELNGNKSHRLFKIEDGGVASFRNLRFVNGVAV